MDQKHDQLLLAILQVNRDPWRQIARSGQEETWLKTLDPRVRVLHLLGDLPAKPTQILGDRFVHLVKNPVRRAFARSTFGAVGSLYGEKVPFYEVSDWENFAHPALKVSSPDTLFHLPRKEIALFHYFMTHTTCEFLCMSNTSSYINSTNLYNLIESLPKKRFVGGRLGEFQRSTFVSGSFRVLSRDFVEFVLENRKHWNYALIDDLSLSELLHKGGATMVPISSSTYTNDREIRQADLVKLRETIHFRMKSGDIKHRVDANLMHQLHDRIRS